MLRFTNKVVLVTGGAAGIGKATAQAFVNEGATVVIWDVNEAAGNELVNNWNAQGKVTRFAKVNVAKLDDVQAGVDAIVSEFGKVDVLINNAGITADRSFLKMDAETWQRVIDINLTGVFNCAKAVVPSMVENKFGVILNASSVVGLYGNFGQTNYVATKAGVIGMTKTLSKELARKGIRVNAVAPGFIATEMVAKMPEEVLKGMEAKTPIGRLGKPEDIANAYVFLASDEASFITGTTLSVDGGVVIG
ncbi:3-oxoacyl-[acyl-carrier-protein] reductase [bacterium]|nr:MAG: 3-oxoacyl-[acyl-carrier-protein] reductase [bacterium]